MNTPNRKRNPRPFTSILSWLVIISALMVQHAVADTLLRTELDGFDGYELLMWTNEFPAGSTTDLHRHSGHEVLFVLEGEVTVRVGDKTTTYKKGAAVHVTAGSSMQVKNVSQSPAKTLVYMLAKKGALLKHKN